MKKISIVIVTYNSKLLIVDCLNSIFKNNDIGEGLEVIIVDNKSSDVDEMFTWVKENYGSKVQLIKNDINGGYGQGNNVGIKKAQAPFVMIMNPDVRLTTPVFQKILHYFSDPKVAMIGMKQMVSERKKGLSFSVKLNFIPVLGTLLTIICNNYLQYYIPSLMYFSGAAFFIRKDVFEEIGLFDENMFMYGEENDVHNRLLKYDKSLKLKYDKNINYIHLVEGRPISNKSLEESLKSMLYFCEKNGLSKKKIIKKQMLDQDFWIIVNLLRGNKDKLKHHQLLKSYLKEILLKL